MHILPAFITAASLLLAPASMRVGHADATRNDDVPTARAAFKDAAGATVGDATLRQTANGVLLKVDLRGVKPGIHAFHIHETGQCTAPSFESAGGHFASQKRQHGFLDAGGPHAGDLPNVHVLESGDVSFEYFVEDVTLSGGNGASLLDTDGSALVMHAGSDDYHTDPAGAAGARLACGVIMQ